MPMCCQTPRIADTMLRVKTIASNDNFLPVERQEKWRGLEKANRQRNRGRYRRLLRRLLRTISFRMSGPGDSR